MTGNPWIKIFDGGGYAPRMLIGFPYGGAPASSYLRLSRALGTDVPLASIQYPGRQERSGEEFRTGLVELAAEAAAALTTTEVESVVLFGHCMGALIAFETARLLGPDGPGVAALVVSGSQAPHRVGERETATPDDEIRRDAAELGGVDARVIADPSLMEVYFPALRADYSAVDGYRYALEPTPPLHCPVTAIAGRQDPRVTAAGVNAWEELTTGSFAQTWLPGEHFYFAEDPAPLAGLLRSVWQTTGEVHARG